jgi:hypothetical protein
MTAGRIARELCWMSQEFSPATIIISMAVHTHISVFYKSCKFYKITIITKNPAWKTIDQLDKNSNG